MAIASAIVASAALIFTVTSFWWIQVRRGKLISFPPQTFSGHLSKDSSAIRLPLTIFNTGAAPIVATDLRLRLQNAAGNETIMDAQTFRRSLKPVTDDVDDFMHPIAVPGRTVVSKHIEFTSAVPPTELLVGTPVRATVEAMQDHGSVWVGLLSFPLHVEIMAHTSAYITYSNQPHLWPPDFKSKAQAAHAQLRQQIMRKEATTQQTVSKAED